MPDRPGESPGGVLETLSGAQRGALALLRLYKSAFSPMFAGSCRFVPSCSEYASEAIASYGVLRGMYLAARRLARCHPMGGHGFDPIPGPRTRV